MKLLKSFNILMTSAILGLACGTGECGYVNRWEKTASGITDPVTSLYASDSFLLAGTTKAIYRASQDNALFVPVLQLHSSSKTVHEFYRNPQQSSSIYAATDAGVFVSQDEGRSWSNIYSSFDARTRKVNTVIADFDNIYVGTAKGLYLRELNEKYWQQAGGELGRKAIFHLAEDNQYLYAVTDSEVYRLQKDGEELKKIFSLIGKEATDESLEETPDQLPRVRDLAVSLQGTLYLALENKILLSPDCGETWKDFSTKGLAVEAVQALMVEGEEILAATSQGVFRYTDGAWISDLSGLDSNQVNALLWNDGELYAATSRGIFKKQALHLSDSSLDETFHGIRKYEILKTLEAEPTIKDVQRMAIVYAQVGPEQITRWHHQARTRAFFPSLSVGLSRGDGELLHWDTTPNPDVLMKGREYTDWSASFSWDLGDLIWSTDQTSIDSRSKLMSEMRQDILDQITRLYFERRRLQYELTKLEDAESADYFDRQIRIDELTALIDGFTGGEYSKHLASRSLHFAND